MVLDSLNSNQITEQHTIIISCHLYKCIHTINKFKNNGFFLDNE